MQRPFLLISGVTLLLTAVACVSTSAGPIPVQTAAKSESRLSAPASADVAEKLRQQQISRSGRHRPERGREAATGLGYWT